VHEGVEDGQDDDEGVAEPMNPGWSQRANAAVAEEVDQSGEPDEDGGHQTHGQQPR